MEGNNFNELRNSLTEKMEEMTRDNNKKRNQLKELNKTLNDENKALKRPALMPAPTPHIVKYLLGATPYPLHIHTIPTPYNYGEAQGKVPTW